MNLGVSIANLLRRYPAVAVPGIGVFKKTHTPAFYDAGQAAYLPPADHITLVEEHTDVFPVTAYLETQLQVDGPMATAMLETAVKEVRASLSRNSRVLLEGLGYLANDGASVVFKPFEVGGLAAKPIAVSVTHEADAAGVAVDATADEDGGKRSKMPWFIAAAVTVAVIGVAAVWHYQPAWFGGRTLTGLFERNDEPRVSPGNQGRSDETPPVVAAERDSIAVDTAHVAAVAVGPNPADDSVVVTNAAPAKPPVTYEIIVGSFATMRQANKFVAEMKAKGYDLQAIDSRMPGNRKKISWGSFATEEAAYKELARVQKTFEPGAWIAKIEHE